ncbi:Uncharacterized protein dnm_031870 [Desulfonema magnum]|uniref:Uncharacterized protein n=1 Tax=Desulfonema magnum TaxID=45655 RepID=A0A975BKM9_9BACT|nr:Uncharacterized protein dnm_031870 [Desulfonema magnum]
MNSIHKKYCFVNKIFDAVNFFLVMMDLKGGFVFYRLCPTPCYIKH